MAEPANLTSSLSYERVGVGDLRTFDGNPRRGDVDAIAASLTKHGQYRPIVVNNGTLTGRRLEVLAGNHTLLAARQLGWSDVEVAAMVRNSCPPGGKVFDPFGGSGSTLIAAHGLGLRAFLAELDPRYADVILRRFQAHTGEVPTLEGRPVSFVEAPAA